LRLLFAALSGYDSQDPFSAPVPLSTPNLRDLRVGVAEQFYEVPVAPAVRQAVQQAAAALAQIRIPAEPFQPAGLESAPNLWWFFFGQLPAPLTRTLIQGKEDQAHW